MDVDGTIEGAAMVRYRWVDDRTLEVELRDGEHFADGGAMTAAAVKRSFDEQFRWRSPHPSGSHFVMDPRTRCQVIDEGRVRSCSPSPTGWPSPSCGPPT